MNLSINARLVAATIVFLMTLLTKNTMRS